MQTRPFGILNLNKPPHMTSRRAVNVVERLVAPAKAGHAGTLDPLATGVLVIAIGRATRLIEKIQSRSKRYRATFLLGCRSNTDDVTGDVTVVTESPDVDANQIAAALTAFAGWIDQVPPAFSAVHVQGRRAYKLARRGKAVELEPRPVEVYAIELVDFDNPYAVIDIHCGSGTYVRSIARDLGDSLRCGAVMSQLVRTAVGPYHLDNSVAPEDVTIDTLSDVLIPPVTAVEHLPQHRCSAAEIEEIINGRKFELSIAAIAGSSQSDSPHEAIVAPRAVEEPAADTPLVLLTPEGELAALAQFSAVDRIVAPKQVYCDVPE